MDDYQEKHSKHFTAVIDDEPVEKAVSLVNNWPYAIMIIACLALLGSLVLT